MKANLHHPTTGGESGFTLLELIVGLLILSIASIGSLGVINFATRQVQRSGEINELNTLIESDLAQVRSANDRLVCTAGNCSIALSDPGEAGYFPATTIGMNFFENLCAYRSGGSYNPSSGFAAQLESLLPPADGRLQRTLTFTDPNNPDLYAGHRYTVAYTVPGGDTTILRQVTLVPATVAWCPSVPSCPSADPLCP